MSEETAKKVDEEVKKIVDKGYERARKVLTEKIEDLHKLSKALLIYETLSGDEIRDLILKDIKPCVGAISTEKFFMVMKGLV